jgi:hypothetical protein
MEEIVEQKAASPKHGVRSRDNVSKVQKLNEIKHFHLIPTTTVWAFPHPFR